MVIKKDVTQCTMWLIEAVSYNAFLPNVNVVEDSTLAHILPFLMPLRSLWFCVLLDLTMNFALVSLLIEEEKLRFIRLLD